MAPIPPTPPRATKPLKSILKKTSTTSVAQPPAPLLFATSKKDKRRIRHAQLLSKVTKSATGKPRQRRRPSKKLITTLDALADALPDADDDGDGSRGVSTSGNNNLDGQVNIIKRKSMKSRPGALKRREKLDQSERERFARNMAQMAVGSKPAVAEESGMNPTPSVPVTTEKWAALRSFIAQTLEQKPELKALKS